ncbi:c-type cytochrome [Luteimonas suaedae]|uniref:c-type cytochrome n=1 Tax=Luteimonas suaedae TaxID=2605430 RepID=UPI0011EC8FA2|nr:cytochrome c [Luteimonas suaedae]
MEGKRKPLWTGVAAGVVGTLLALFLGALLVAYTGAYNIAASTGHTAGMRWLLDHAMHASVRSRAPKDGVAARLGEADLAAGAGEYKAMCEHCHGGPDTEPAGWSRGMRPRAPHLTDAASQWEPAEVFWIVRHGIKYTGMPSFGESHDEATLWNIAAFVDRLPAMTPEQYRAYGDAHGHAGTSSDVREKAGNAAHGGARKESATDAGREPHAHGDRPADRHH